MHDMIEEMGKEIVRQESPQEPGNKQDRRHLSRFGCTAICFTNELRWLEWPKYTSLSLPFCSGLKKLAGPCMARSSIWLLGQEFRLYRNLKFINFSYCTHLIQVPDVSSMQNLERVDAKGCQSLVDVHDSLSHLDKLIHLNFSNCSSLSNYPRSLKSELLQSLVLKGCSVLSKFPDVLVEVKGMKELSLEELPSMNCLLLSVILLD
ncbi:disease resistance-like protein DSC1 [Punica granatum]|uniref:Disease resistance-like protein DSC1 n=1 Tax=Punica granatum TaxID=22663 RepID=A0A6P8D001_PUNGR|nr:disease resistance-like protein DSC1 [Punica granatum]